MKYQPSHHLPIYPTQLMALPPYPKPYLTVRTPTQPSTPLTYYPTTQPHPAYSASPYPIFPITPQPQLHTNTILSNTPCRTPIQWRQKLENLRDGEEKFGVPSKTHQFWSICLLHMDNFATFLYISLPFFIFLSNFSLSLQF